MFITVTEDNLDEVMWCLNTPANDKRARSAAKLLFQAVNPMSPNTHLFEMLSKPEKKLIEKTSKIFLKM